MKQVAQPVSNTLINNNHHRHHNNLNNTNFILKKCRTQIKNIFENIQQQHWKHQNNVNYEGLH